MSLVYANHAESTLAASVSASATTIQLAAGGGALYPQITATDASWFPLHLIKLPAINAASNTVTNIGHFEILRAIAVNGDTITVERGQEGTAAQTFDPGDVTSLRLTRAALLTLAQTGTRDFTVLRGINYGIAGGSINAITATVAGVSSYSSNLYLRIKPVGANTGPVTINVNDIGAVPIRRPDGISLHAGAIAANRVVELLYNEADGRFIIQNPVAEVRSATVLTEGIVQTGTETDHDIDGDNAKYTTQRTVSRIVTDALRGRISADLPIAWGSRGNSTDGDLVVSNGQTSQVNVNAPNRYNNVTLGAGGIIESTQDGVLVIRCVGRFTSSGTLRVPLNTTGYPVPFIGPSGGKSQTQPDAAETWPVQQTFFEVQNNKVDGRRTNPTEVLSAILSGTPLQAFHGGNGSTYGDADRVPRPTAGGLIILAGEVVLNGSSAIAGAYVRPQINFPASGDSADGPGGGGICILVTPNLTINSAATFEFGTETDFQTAAALLAKANAGTQDTPGAANGQCFHLDPETLLIKQIF